MSCPCQAENRENNKNTFLLRDLQVFLKKFPPQILCGSIWSFNAGQTSAPHSFHRRTWRSHALWRKGQRSRFPHSSPGSRREPGIRVPHQSGWTAPADRGPVHRYAENHPHLHWIQPPETRSATRFSPFGWRRRQKISDAIPHYYKVIFDLTPPQKKIGFVLPNEGSNKPLANAWVGLADE